VLFQQWHGEADGKSLELIGSPGRLVDLFSPFQHTGLDHRAPEQTSSPASPVKVTRTTVQSSLAGCPAQKSVTRSKMLCTFGQRERESSRSSQRNRPSHPLLP